MGMLNSVEMRCPFLNPKLIQYFLSLKPSLLYDQNLNKGKYQSEIWQKIKSQKNS